MGKYVLQRLLAFIPTLLVITVLVAMLIDLIPGDPAQLMAGDDAPAEVILQRRQQMGLDRPWHVRLVEYVLHAARGDLGTSFFLNKSVTQTILDRYQITLSLAGFALLISITLGIVVGILAAVNQGGWLDWLVMTLSMVTLSLPGFWLALNLILFFGVTLRWLPVGGYVPLTKDPVDFLKHLVLPATEMGLAGAASIARFTRTSMLEVLRQEYITVARAKGLPQRAVLLRHALKNALIPILTVIGMQVGGLLGGAAITETVFAMPGIGRMIADSVARRDYPLIQGGILVITVSYLTINLLVDVLYAWVDPRIRY